jgi:hypothetical protein
LPPQTLRVTTAGRIACSSRQFVASTAGLARKNEERVGFRHEVPHKALDVGHGRARREGLEDLSLESASGDGEAVRRHGVALDAIAQRERLLERGLDLSR